MTPESIKEKLDTLAIHFLEETWAGLNRNASPEEIEKNKKLGDIWKRTLTMSHDEYLSRLHHGIRAQGREGGNEGKAVQAIISAREKDSDADDANKEKMKKVKPKTNVYQ